MQIILIWFPHYCLSDPSKMKMSSWQQFLKTFQWSSVDLIIWLTVWLLFTIFCFLCFCVIVLVRISRTILKRRHERDHPCLAPDLSRKTFIFSSLIMILAIRFFRYSLSSWGRSVLFPVYWEFLSWMSFYYELNFINFFPASIDIIIFFSFFSLFL